ncbi:MAG: hypothetical protein ACYC2G_15735 [Gemmatimonadaceae bacterium]
MADSAPGSPDARARPLTFLPPELAGRSLSATELAFGLADAELALGHLAAAGHLVTAWDCWVAWPSGARARSLAHQGSFSLPLDVARAADAAADGMRRVQERWDRSPEYPGTTVYFTIELAG